MSSSFSSFWLSCFLWKLEAEQGCRIVCLPTWHSLACQFSASGRFSGQLIRDSGDRAVVSPFFCGCRALTGNTIKNWGWRRIREKQSKGGYQDWSSCKIQLYEHSGNNVGFELTKYASGCLHCIWGICLWVRHFTFLSEISIFPS